MSLVRQERVAAVFAPTPDTMYLPGYQTEVRVRELSTHLCGKSRPVHFAGVATVVTKLFNVVQPDVAVFGEKDFQQLAVIRRMVQDLNIPVKIVGHPIVREADGLAMSSRNAYLDPANRAAALSLSTGLARVREMAAAGERSVAVLSKMLEAYIHSFSGTAIDYASFVHADTRITSYNVCYTKLLRRAFKEADLVVYRNPGGRENITNHFQFTRDILSIIPGDDGEIDILFKPHP